jgi:RNA polymerase sigma factor (sigma-70 family)
VNDAALQSSITRLSSNDRDESAWEDLYRQVFPYLMAIVYRGVGGKRFLAEEGVQEIMLRFLRSYKFDASTASPGSVVSYLKQTSQSVLSDMRRRQTREEHFQVAIEEHAESSENVDPAADPITRSLLDEAFQRAAGQLNARGRAVVELLVQGRTLGEVADALNVSEKTAYNVVALVRRHMRDCLFAP